MKTLFPTLLIVLVALVGCDRNSGTEAGKDEGSTSQTSVEPSPAEANTPEPPPAPALSNDEVEEVVSKWLEAQNRGEFEMYASLYAPKFEGIKRIGARKYSFARKGWLDDRARMFEKPMTVSAEGLDVSTAGPTAVARFEQTWSSGDFTDIGPKQLVIIDTEAGPRIAREEMLMSTVVSSENPASFYNPLQAAIVAESDYVVLALDTAGVETGNVRVLDRRGKAIADVTELPKTLEAFVGQTFIIEGSKAGAAGCRGKVESLHVLARAVPHFGQVDYWNGELDEPRLSDEQVAQEIWELSKGPGHILVGKIDGSCGGGVWAHSPEAEFQQMPSSPAPEELADRLVEAFRKTPGHNDIQKSFASFGGRKPWSESATNVTIWGPDDAPKHAFVWASVGDGCGEFMGSFWAVYELGPNGELKLSSDPRAPGELEIPLAAFEVEGEVVFMSDDAQIRRSGEWLRRTAEATVPYFDCPC